MRLWADSAYRLSGLASIALVAPLFVGGCDVFRGELQSTLNQLKSQLDAAQASLDSTKKERDAALAKLAAAADQAGQNGGPDSGDKTGAKDDSKWTDEEVDKECFDDANSQLAGVLRRLGAAKSAALTVLAMTKLMTGKWDHGHTTYEIEKFELTGQLHWRAVIKTTVDDGDEDRQSRQTVTGTYDTNRHMLHMPESP